MSEVTTQECQETPQDTKTTDNNSALLIDTDELTLRQQDAIEKEISKAIPLVGKKEPLLNLLSEYVNDDVYKSKINEINKNYDLIRRMRPDGNCFFRAFCFSAFEGILQKPEEIENFRLKMASSKDILTEGGLTMFTVDDFYEYFLEMVDKVKEGLSDDDLYEKFQDQNSADYLVVFLRILTSAELRRCADFYKFFIDGDRTLEDFCQYEVEPMAKESDHIHIIALAKALGIGVKVIYMDRGTGEHNEHNFPDEIPPSIHMLYRPGHYDLLYPKKG